MQTDWQTAGSSIALVRISCTRCGLIMHSIYRRLTLLCIWHVDVPVWRGKRAACFISRAVDPVRRLWNSYSSIKQSHIFISLSLSPDRSTLVINHNRICRYGGGRASQMCRCVSAWTGRWVLPGSWTDQQLKCRGRHGVTQLLQPLLDISTQHNAAERDCRRAVHYR